MLKYFIITVDTEGDNLWKYSDGTEIKTENTLHIPRFQKLCEKYRLKPVYLTNYEMALDDRFVEMAKSWYSYQQCEIGIHLHAWNNPPEFKLTGNYDYNPYLIEYPNDIKYDKFGFLFNLIKERFGISPVSHRAGRWAMNADYFNILEKFGILVDCSYTPGIDWSKNEGITCCGTDYSKISNEPQFIGNVLEVPMTIRHFRHNYEGSLKHKIRTSILGDKVWLRPATQSVQLMKMLISRVEKEKKVDYLEFMIHSSELMPGGSPYADSVSDVNKLFSSMEEVFKFIKNRGLIGITLQEYYNIYIKNRT